MTYKKMSFISGIILFITLVFFFGSIIWLTGENIFLPDSYRLYIEFSEVAGIRDNSPVFMRGYKVGSTKGINMKKEGVLVEIDVKKKFHIPVDSVVEINTLNFIGEKAITITPSESERYLVPNSVMFGQNKDLIIIAKNTLSSLKTKIEEGDLDEEIERIAKSIESFHTLVRNIDTKVNQLDIDIYNNQIKEIGLTADNFEEFLAAVQKDTNSFSLRSSESLEKFNLTMEQSVETLQRLSELSVELTEIAQEIRIGRGTAGEILHNKEYAQNLNKTVLELKAFLEDIQKNPKKYVKFSIF